MSNRDVVDPLKRLLANSYTPYITPHSYHWNATGPLFSTHCTRCSKPSTRSWR